MTNEDKAKELLNCAKCSFRQGKAHITDIPENPCAICADYKAVLQIAEWKDAIIDEVKEKLASANYSIRKLTEANAKLVERIRTICKESSYEIVRLDEENKKLKRELKECGYYDNRNFI